jgi:hypothetical protein
VTSTFRETFAENRLCACSSRRSSVRGRLKWPPGALITGSARRQVCVKSVDVVVHEDAQSAQGRSGRRRMLGLSVASVHRRETGDPSQSRPLTPSEHYSARRHIPVRRTCSGTTQCRSGREPANTVAGEIK